ncbi:hypothetical protein R4576_18045 [Acinetobacter baumannii]|nr:hypothetical protein [Acinetobacter baumannii]
MILALLFICGLASVVIAISIYKYTDLGWFVPLVVGAMVFYFSQDLTSSYWRKLESEEKSTEINIQNYAELNDKYNLVKGSDKGELLRTELLKALQDGVIDRGEYETLTGEEPSLYFGTEERNLKFKNAKENLIFNLTESPDLVVRKFFQSVKGKDSVILDKSIKKNEAIYKVEVGNEICAIKANKNNTNQNANEWLVSFFSCSADEDVKALIK